MSTLTNAKDEIKIKFPSWSADVRDLQAESAALPDFKAFYERLIHDDLPACLKKFKRKFNDSVKEDITNFSTRLDRGRTQIIQGIGELNKSLKTIPYSKNPPAYIKLEHRFTNDIQIKEFQGLLSLDKDINLKILNEEITSYEAQIPLSAFAKINFNSVEYIFIVENLMVYLTLPPFSKALCIFGSGFAAVNLKENKALNEKKLYYFGDMDEHGFEILSNVSGIFPNVKSFCMDKKNL